jgi:hypothetical protein
MPSSVRRVDRFREEIVRSVASLKTIYAVIRFSRVTVSSSQRPRGPLESFLSFEDTWAVKRIRWVARVFPRRATAENQLKYVFKTY